MFTVDKVLDEIMQLDFSTREMLVEILNRRQIEERRAEIKRRGKKAKLDFSRGKLKSYSAKEIIKHLHSI
jgi:hypothetical protein